MTQNLELHIGFKTDKMKCKCGHQQPISSRVTEFTINMWRKHNIYICRNCRIKLAYKYAIKEKQNDST